jgi:polysaccharide export outer membrane protein
MLVSLPVAAQAPVVAQSPPVAEAGTFRLRSGDAIRLLVRDEPELTGEFPVLEDGSVLLPLIGLVPVAGVVFGEVESRVRAGYARELVDRGSACSRYCGCR